MAMLSTALKTLFSLLACVMAVALVYSFIKEFMHFDPNARWGQAAFIEFCIEISFIAAWFFYKESRWILRVVFIIILFWFGSFTVCGYIILQLFKLSPEESSKDPIYFVLVRRQNRDSNGGVSVVTAKIIFVTLGCLMLGILLYVFIIDGSPFHAQVFTPDLMLSDPLLVEHGNV
ncbi:hypothetical protein M8C21_021858 [Ambrosia artemisiifolia]|uniref:Uncharacterized protein n=1 Tax=Ambrosia artemisiifolia TaxID=4212 RepID=A0AAD5G1U8_AMBAR|nr:hypothetical protein M8C21_021858 [Ambrosia artemisiifolia]